MGGVGPWVAWVKNLAWVKFLAWVRGSRGSKKFWRGSKNFWRRSKIFWRGLKIFFCVGYNFFLLFNVGCADIVLILIKSNNMHNHIKS